MKLTRREVLKLWGASAAGISISQMYGLEIAETLAHAAANNSIIWIQGASCSGCSVSILNTVEPCIADVLVDVIQLHYQPTLMAAAGQTAMGAMWDAAEEPFYLVVEGAVPDGPYCGIGEDEHGTEITMLDAVEDLGANANAIIALGTCAAHGGIPKAYPNPTGAQGVKDILDVADVDTPLINLPGCPTHPDWFILTLLHVLEEDDLPALDEDLRPTAFFGETVCENCPLDKDGNCARHFGDKGCLRNLGCKGRETKADCPLGLWNNGTEWCVGVGSPCIGCTHKEFPDIGGVSIYEPLRRNRERRRRNRGHMRRNRAHSHR